MMGCKLADTPIDLNSKLVIHSTSNPIGNRRYQHLVGKLTYLSHIRHDIAFAMSCVSQFMRAPSKEHMEVVYQILKYQKRDAGKGLFFKKTEERGENIYRR